MKALLVVLVLTFHSFVSCAGRDEDFAVVTIGYCRTNSYSDERKEQEVRDAFSQAKKKMKTSNSQFIKEVSAAVRLASTNILDEKKRRSFLLSELDGLQIYAIAHNVDRKYINRWPMDRWKDGKTIEECICMVS